MQLVTQMGIKIIVALAICASACTGLDLIHLKASGILAVSKEIDRSLGVRRTVVEDIKCNVSECNSLADFHRAVQAESILRRAKFQSRYSIPHPLPEDIAPQMLKCQ